MKGHIRNRRSAYRPRSKTATSYLMSRIRGRDTHAEVKLRKVLHAAGYRFRKNVKNLVGKPDIVFPRFRAVVFVDGDFWHARILKEGGKRALRNSLKTANKKFWISKLEGNYRRDLQVDAELAQLGWLVIRVWESDVKKACPAVAASIQKALIERRPSVREPKAPVVDH